MRSPRDLTTLDEFDKLLERLAEFGWEGGELDEDDLEQYDIAPYEEDEEE